jgi:hypothetical protein
MPIHAPEGAPFEARRRKEYVAFLVVKFLRAHISFMEIAAEFRAALREQKLGSCGLRVRVGDLSKALAFDIKEMAHFLFRGNGRPAPGTGKSVSRRTLGELKTLIEARSMDSFIGTGYHLLMVLEESLYQLEAYTPAHEQEQVEISRLEALARRIGYTFSPDEIRELEHLRALSEISMKLSVETRDLTLRIVERCQQLFGETAEVLRHFIESAGENEILVQNLLMSLELFERVYGQGAAEKVFWAMFRRKGVEGSTGMEKAVSFARGRCGNVEGLPPATGRAP